jgi:hypothetical protein
MPDRESKCGERGSLIADSQSCDKSRQLAISPCGGGLLRACAGANLAMSPAKTAQQAQALAFLMINAFQDREKLQQ